jgi:predicted nuclease of restriction endonuclease-like (RecB) superfamily
MLTFYIEKNLFKCQGKAITNFKNTLPEQQARLAGQILKDPYNFGYLTIEPQVQKLEIEKQLTDHIKKFGYSIIWKVIKFLEVGIFGI